MFAFGDFSETARLSSLRWNIAFKWVSIPEVHEQSEDRESANGLLFIGGHDTHG